MSRILSKNECQACFQIALEIFFSPLASHFKLSYLMGAIGLSLNRQCYLTLTDIILL